MKTLEHENLRKGVKFSLDRGLNLTFLDIKARGPIPADIWIMRRRKGGRAGLVLGEFVFPEKFNHKEKGSTTCK